MSESRPRPLSSFSDVQDMIEEIEGAFQGLPLKYQVPWREVTTLGVGSEIPLLAEPRDDIGLIHLLRFCNRREIPVMCLGGGSNMVGCDEPFPGVVIRLVQNDFVKIKLGRDHITCGAGVRLCDLALTAASHGLGGMVPLAAIPGTLGGALKMNAGAHGVEIGNLAVDICGFHLDGSPWCISNRDGHFTWEYRRGPIPDDVIVTVAIIQVERADPREERKRIHEEIIARRMKEPKGRSAGCVFLNPSQSCPAGRMIDHAGLKGRTFGGVKIAEQHANYLINTGNATEKDFLHAVASVRQQVLAKNGVYLKPEICFACAEQLSIQKPAKVTVLKGGDSSEREVSLESGAAVAKALRNAGYDVNEVDISALEVIPEMRECDVVFPVLHGGFGESGKLQKMLEDAGILYVGCNSKASAIVIDKLKSKAVMAKRNIPTADYAVVTPEDRSFPASLSLPVIVKPPLEGSTMGISKVSDMSEWDAALDLCFEYEPRALVESFIVGAETTVGVLLGKALPMVEIQPPGDMYDYDAKYTHQQGETLYLCPAQTIPEDVQQQAQEVALAFADAVGARHMIRVDMLITAEGDIFVLEGNSIPGFTSSSLLPKAAAANGISFEELCGLLVQAALNE